MSKYCCDGDCGQGRGCPLRVARVKQCYPKYADAYEEPATQRYIRTASWLALCGLLGWLLISVVLAALVV